MNKIHSILITGGAGFIGSHLAESLVKDGYSVSVVDDLSSGSLYNLREVIDQVRFYECSILSETFPQIIYAGDFDLIIHLAANSYVPPSVHNPQYDFDVNLRGTFQLLNILRENTQKSKLIIASSAAVYGDPIENPITESAPLDPISPYGVSKLGGERYAYVFGKLYGIRTTILRFFSVYGPRQRKQFIYDMMVKMRANPLRVEVFGDGSQTRDLLYVEDLARAIKLIMENSEFNGEVINVASGVGYPIFGVIKRIADQLMVHPNYQFTGNVRLGDPIHWVADISKLKKFGFEPTYPLEKGIEYTVRWFLDDTQ